MLRWAFCFACLSCSSAPVMPPPPADAGPPEAARPTFSCTSPSAPFGFKRGDTLDPGFAFQAYVPGADLQPRTYTWGDFFDCDGSKNISAILVEESEEGCGPCESEESDIQPLLQKSWSAMGVVVIVLMHKDIKGEIATLQTAETIRTKYGLTSAIVGIEPNWVFSEYPDVSGYPTNVVIDPRTLRVIDKEAGYGAPGSLAEKGAVLWLVSANRP